MSIQLHQRYFLVRFMENRLRRAVHEIVFARPSSAPDDEALKKALDDARVSGDETILTDAEALQIVAKVLSEHVLSFAKYQIREERHPGEPDKKGDEQ